MFNNSHDAQIGKPILDRWLESFRKVELFPAHYLDLKELMWEHWKIVHEYDTEAEFFKMQEQFKNGGLILPDDIANRIEIGKFCCQTGLPCGVPCNGEENCQEYAILKPLPENGIRDLEMDDHMYAQFEAMAKERQETSILSFLSGAECMLNFIKTTYKLTGKDK